MLLPLFIPIPLVILLNSVNVMHCCTVRQACGSQQCSLHQCRCRTKGVWRELQMFQQRCQQFQLMLQCGNMSVFQMMFNFYIQRQPHHTCYQVHCHSLHMHFHQVLCNSLHWIVLQQKADRPQTPRELKIPLRPNLDLVSFGRAMQKRVTQWLLAQNEDMPDPVPKKKSPPEKLVQAWRRMVLATIRLYLEVMLQSVTDYLTSRNRGTMAKLPKAKKDKSLVPAESKKTAKVRRGIGQPLPRSKACKSWPKEPLDCAHEESQLRQRGSKDSFWWTCLQCGSRWQRVEWEPDMELNAGAASSGEYRGSAGTEKIQTSSKVAYPSRLPPPRFKAQPDNLGRRGGDSGPHRSPDGTRREDDTSTHAVRRTTPNAAGARTEPPPPSSHGDSTNNQSGDRHGGSGTDGWDGFRPNRSDSRSAVGEVDGRAQEGAPQADADGQWSSTCPTKVKVSRTSIIGAGNPGDPHVGRRDDSTQSHPRLSDGDSMKNQVCKSQEYEGNGGCKTKSIAKPLAQATKLAMFATVLVCSQLPDAEQRISTLLGPTGWSLRTATALRVTWASKK